MSETRNYRVLVIADELGPVISDFLEEEGYDVNTIASYGNFKDIFIELSRRRYDVLIPTNNSLSPKHILQIVPIVKSKFPKVKIFVLSGWKESDFITELERLKIDDFSNLPFDPDELIMKINKMLKFNSKRTRIIKAAGQGHEHAQQKLDQLKAKGIGTNDAEGKSHTEPAVGITPSGSTAKKSRTAIRHLHDTEECKALLDACTPHLYINNAFRISGLSVDASMRDIKRRIDDLKSAEEMGDLEDELSHAFALDPAPSLDQIREAAQRLQEPERRIIDEFFWFWPFEPGKSNIDPALKALMGDDKSEAIKIWSDALSDHHANTSTVAKHNLAVIYHIQALDSEQYALNNKLSDEQLLIIANDWRTCFKWWEELADDETLWSMVADRIRTIDDQRLTTGFARRMRATLPEAMDKINAILARDYAERDKYAQATNHIKYMNETHQGKDNVPKILSIIIKPLKARVDNAVDTATNTANNAPDQAARVAFELLEAVSAPLKVIQLMLPAEDHERIDICDSVAEACLKCQHAYARGNKDWATSFKILDAALKYAASKETINRLTEKRSEFTVAQHLLSLSKIIQDIEDLNFPIADKMNVIKKDLLSHLSSVTTNYDISSDIYAECADYVAYYLRGLSVFEYNEHGNLQGALETLEVAISIAFGQEARKKLQEDKSQLINILKEKTKHNLRMTIRSDEIEITNEFVRYNNQKLQISSIQGIKYGVFVQVINGIRTSSYVIDFNGEHSDSIHIECKRVFRSETQAEQDFNRILDALFHQIVPYLIQRLAEQVIIGIPLHVGSCRLTNNGMYITTGALLWKKETLVSFPDLRFNSYSGQVSVSSSKDKGIITSMAIRDIWNAALLEFVTKAVVEMKAKCKSL